MTCSCCCKKKSRSRRRKTKGGSIYHKRILVRSLPPPFLSAANMNLRGGLKILPMLLRGR